jgi:hypothetical protein
LPVEQLRIEENPINNTLFDKNDNIS